MRGRFHLVFYLHFTCLHFFLTYCFCIKLIIPFKITNLRINPNDFSYKYLRKEKDCIHRSSLCYSQFSLLSSNVFWSFNLFIQFLLLLFSNLLHITSFDLFCLIVLLFLFYYLTFSSFPFLCIFFLSFLKEIWCSHMDDLIYFLCILFTRKVCCCTFNKVAYFDWQLCCTRFCSQEALFSFQWFYWDFFWCCCFQGLMISLYLNHSEISLLTLYTEVKNQRQKKWTYIFSLTSV